MKRLLGIVAVLLLVIAVELAVLIVEMRARPAQAMAPAEVIVRGGGPQQFYPVKVEVVNR